MACCCALGVAGCYESDGGGGTDAGGIMFLDSGPGGGGTDAGGATDPDAGGPVTGTDAGVPPTMTSDGGGPPAPYDAGDSVGTLDCMGTPCDAATEQCCITGSTGGASAACIPNTEMCMGGATTCDGPEDCTTGETCCLQVMGFGGMAGCTTEMCGGGGGGGFPSSFELCHDASDCTNSAHMCCPVMLFGFSGAYCSEMCFGGGPTPMP